MEMESAGGSGAAIRLPPLEGTGHHEDDEAEEDQPNPHVVQGHPHLSVEEGSDHGEGRKDHHQHADAGHHLSLQFGLLRVE